MKKPLLLSKPYPVYMAWFYASVLALVPIALVVYGLVFYLIHGAG